MKKIMIILLFCSPVTTYAQDARRPQPAPRVVSAQQQSGLQLATPDSWQPTIEISTATPAQFPQQRGSEIPFVNAAQPNIPAQRLDALPSRMDEKVLPQQPKATKK